MKLFIGKYATILFIIAILGIAWASTVVASLTGMQIYVLIISLLLMISLLPIFGWFEDAYFSTLVEDSKHTKE